MLRLRSLIVLSVLAMGSIGAAVQASEPRLPQATFAPVGDPTKMPYGWYDFCNRRPEECDVPKLSAAQVRLTQETWRTIEKVNNRVNRAIEPVSNLDHWGTLLDHWDYPTDGKGDCKIYALEKRRELLAAGFPRQALLMTIVYDLHGEGHAILTVVTDRGEFVLDNLTDQVRSWDSTGYTFIKRQSQEDPNVWLDLGDEQGPGLTIAALK